VHERLPGEDEWEVSGYELSRNGSDAVLEFSEGDNGFYDFWDE